jgi:hypothetical protein
MELARWRTLRQAFPGELISIEKRIADAGRNVSSSVERRDRMTPKLLISVAAFCLLSGCCRYLGICTSASVHTSITSPQQFAQQGCLEGIQVSQVPIVADVRIARAIQPN